MKFLKVVVVTLIILITYTSFRISENRTPTLYTASYENVLGTSFDLKVKALTEEQSDLAENVALQEISRLSSILSTYDSNSEFNQWFNTSNSEVRVSRELWEILYLFDSWKEKTSGALDAAAGGVIKIWKEAERQQHLPDRSVIESTLQEIKQQHWKLDPDKSTATHLTTTPLVLNSFVKSYIIHKVAERVMQIEGISAVVVNIGGDILVMGDHEEMVSISNPQEDAENQAPLTLLRLKNKAIATSGNYRRGFTIGGHKYSHIVDPRTGLAVDHILSATVISDDATEAGALATAFNILSPSEASAIAATLKGVEYQLVLADGTMMESKGWKQLQQEVKKKEPEVSEMINEYGAQSWNKNYVVDINLSLMRFPTMTRRPFVAVWVEDEEKKPVKTLALWYNKPRWLPDLHEWYHKNYTTFQNSPQGIYSISSATRPAGYYTLMWDGKNDQGEYVKDGKYTVFIEVVREHGTYQLMKQEINCKGKAQKFEIQGNEEVGGASVEYKKTQNGK